MTISVIPLPGIENAVFRPDQEGAFPAQKGGRWGLLDLKGEVVVPFLYGEVHGGFHEGLANVSRKPLSPTWGLVVILF